MQPIRSKAQTTLCRPGSATGDGAPLPYRSFRSHRRLRLREASRQIRSSRPMSRPRARWMPTGASTRTSCVAARHALPCQPRTSALEPPTSNLEHCTAHASGERGRSERASPGELHALPHWYPRGDARVSGKAFPLPQSINTTYYLLLPLPLPTPCPALPCPAPPRPTPPRPSAALAQPTGAHR